MHVFLSRALVWCGAHILQRVVSTLRKGFDFADSALSDSESGFGMVGRVEWILRLGAHRYFDVVRTTDRSMSQQH